MKCIAIFDTSALFVVAEGRASLDSISEVLPDCEFIVVDAVVQELEKFARKSYGKKAILAKWILQNIIPKLRVVESGFVGEADDIIISFGLKLLAEGFRCVVISTDSKVKEKALRSGLEVVTYRETEGRFEQT